MCRSRGRYKCRSRNRDKGRIRGRDTGSRYISRDIGRGIKRENET